MSKTGNTRENLVTGYRAVVQVGTKDSGGEPLVTDLYLRLDRPSRESTSIRPSRSGALVLGRVGFRIDRRESLMELDQRLHVPVRVAHDWWNAGEEAYIIVESSPGERFEEMIVNLLGLAQDGKTKRKGDAQPLAGRDLHPGVQ